MKESTSFEESAVCATPHSKGNPSWKETQLVLRPCQHQVAGHLFESGKDGSLVDDFGSFYKPLQPGLRGARELAFYEAGFRCSNQNARPGEPDYSDDLGSVDEQWNYTGVYLKYVPRFAGTVMMGGRKLLVLEDVAARYSKPCVMDVKIGYRTWYLSADDRYISRAQAKDRATTQAVLGFKVCGWQVYKHSIGAICRASKSLCKTLTENDIDRAFLDFSDNETGLGPQSVLGGTFGALPQLLELRTWFEHQRKLHFYSSSILILYEGSAACPEDLNLRVCLVDFAHTFPSDGTRDQNFLEGLSSLIDHFQSLAEDRNTGRCFSPISKLWGTPAAEKHLQAGLMGYKPQSASRLVKSQKHP